MIRQTDQDQSLAIEEFFQRMNRRGPAGPSDRLGQWDLFGAYRHAVLSVAADLHAAGAGQGVVAIIGQDFAGRVVVEQHRLRDRGGSDKAFVIGGRFPRFEGFVRFVRLAGDFDLQVLRAGFQAATTAHALAERVVLLLLLR